MSCPIVRYGDKALLDKGASSHGKALFYFCDILYTIPAPVTCTSQNQQVFRHYWERVFTEKFSSLVSNPLSLSTSNCLHESIHSKNHFNVSAFVCFLTF